MEDQADRIKNEMPVVESYWLKRKAEREQIALEKDEKALEFLSKAYKFYEEKYPKSEKGITYDNPKGKISKISFEGSREDSIIFRNVLEYYKNESIISIDDEWKVGHAFWRVNKNIPDLSQINKILSLKKKKKDMEREIHRLENTKVETIKKIEVEKELHFICQWCDKEFIGSTARFEIKEHILKCPKSPTKPEEPPEEDKIPEKLFTCNVCGIELNRNDMKDHAWKCKKTKEAPKKESIIVEVSKFICPVEGCGKDCNNGAGMASHMKTHNKE